MILADTSVWVNHLRRADRRLSELLTEGEVLTHPFVIGELACGSIGRRKEILGLLEELPGAAVADHGEVMKLLDELDLWGRGLGWIDVHLLTSARLTGCELWTLDRRLGKVAGEFGGVAS